MWPRLTLRRRGCVVVRLFTKTPVVVRMYRPRRVPGFQLRPRPRELVGMPGVGLTTLTPAAVPRPFALPLPCPASTGTVSARQRTNQRATALTTLLILISTVSPFTTIYCVGEIVLKSRGEFESFCRSATRNELPLSQSRVAGQQLTGAFFSQTAAVVSPNQPPPSMAGESLPQAFQLPTEERDFRHHVRV
jgi:hypothetical protein